MLPGVVVPGCEEAGVPCVAPETPPVEPGAVPLPSPPCRRRCQWRCRSQPIQLCDSAAVLRRWHSWLQDWILRILS